MGGQIMSKPLVETAQLDKKDSKFIWSIKEKYVFKEKYGW